jgi:hypothetical protein
MSSVLNENGRYLEMRRSGRGRADEVPDSDHTDIGAVLEVSRGQGILAGLIENVALAVRGAEISGRSRGRGLIQDFLTFVHIGAANYVVVHHRLNRGRDVGF